MELLMFVFVWFFYETLINCCGYVFSKREKYPIAAIPVTIFGVAFSILFKPLLLIWFFNSYITPLLPFELTISYWSMFAINIIVSLLSVKTEFKEG